MVDIEEHLSKWRTAGVIDAATESRIRAHESRDALETVGADDRPGILEALAYLGIAVLAVGVIIMVTVSWDDLEPWARVAVMAIPGLLAIAVGATMRSSGRPGLVRGGHIAWMVAVALLGGAVATAAANADARDENVALYAGLVATVAAGVLWVFAPSHPQVLALGLSIGVVCFALGGRSDDFSEAVAGLTLMVAGMAGVFVAERRWLVPMDTARAVSAAGLAMGAYVAGFERGFDGSYFSGSFRSHPFEVLSLVAAAFLIALSIRQRTLVYMLFGVAVAFLGMVTSLTRHAGSPTAAAAGLILIGALLLGVVLLLARWQPWERRTA